MQTITVKDNTPPTFTAPADTTIYKDANCEYDASVTSTGDVTDEMDNCSANLNATYEDQVDVTDSCTIVITRTWSLVDNCNNAAQNQVQTITVKDNTPPTFTAPADITIFTDDTCGYDARISVTGDVTDEADNCTPAANLNATFEDNVNNDDPCNITITRTWSLVDDCGNVAVSVQTITVSDTTKPTFTAPADTIIYKDANCEYDASVSVTGDVTDEADNCSENLEATFVDEVDDNDPCNITITRAWSLVDACGNTAENQVQTITVKDTIRPTYTRPENITIYRDDNGFVTIDTNTSGTPSSVHDNCTPAPTVTYRDEEPVNDCEGSYHFNRVWRVVDACGNMSLSDSVQLIMVSDTIKPTFMTPLDTTIFTDDSCNYDASISVTGEPTEVHDNCSRNIEPTYSDTITNGTCQGSYVIFRTWHLEDDCGNAAEDQIQTITVMDNTAPTFTAPADTTIYTNDTCGYDASPNVTGDVTDETDNCSTGIEATFADDTIAGTCQGEYVIRRTWSLVDDCDNAAENQIQIITVKDNTPPTFTVPANITIFTDDTCGYDASVSVTGDVRDVYDNCSTNIEATYSDTITDGNCQGSYVITRTWHLEDNCGNAAEDQIQTITVMDTTKPVITIDSANNPNGACEPTIVAPTFAVSDNCEGTFTRPVDSITDGGVQNTSACGRSQTWIAHYTDACGNMAENVEVTYTWGITTTGEDDTTVCNSFTLYDSTYTESTNIIYVLSNSCGCDSIVTLHLTVNPTYSVTDAKTICESELPYIWNGETFNEAGTQSATLQTVNGCDSTVTMTLTVNPNPPIGLIEGDTLLCQNQYTTYEYTGNMDVDEYEYMWYWNEFTLADTNAVTVYTPTLGFGMDTIYPLTIRVTTINEPRCSSETMLNVHVCSSISPTKVTVERKGTTNILYCDQSYVPTATTTPVIYRWGYTEKATGEDFVPNPSWNQRYYAYPNGIDTVENLYWVETSIESVNNLCVNRSYYQYDPQGSPMSVDDISTFDVRAYVSGNYLIVEVANPRMQTVKASVYDIGGRLLQQYPLGNAPELHSQLPFVYAKGVYVLKLMIGNNVYSTKIIR